jgi:CRP/FNR family cyclic AMP-dependent transcriptional regulator
MTSDISSRKSGCQLCAGQKHCLLGQQAPTSLAAWTPLVTERSVRKGELLLQQGQLGHSFKIVKTGTALLMRAGDDGVARPVGLSGMGQPLGTTTLLGYAATLSCRMLTAGRICEVQIPQTMPPGMLDASFLHGLASSFSETNARLADWSRIVRIRGMSGRMAATLLKLSKVQRSSLVHLPSHQVLAELLSTTRETVARTLRQLVLHQGIARRGRSHCDIQPQVLRCIASGQRQEKAALDTATSAPASSLSLPTS